MRTKFVLPAFVHVSILFAGCSSGEDFPTDTVSQSVMVDFSELPEYRQIDGTGNNVQFPQRGSAGSILKRLSPPAYADGAGALAGPDRPGPREISNAVVAQSGSIPDPDQVTDMFWLWGQFLDHDVDLTFTSTEAADIAVPTGDPLFDPLSTGTEVIPFDRSASTPVAGVRQQRNEITAYIDGSNVYGSTTQHANSLRALDGSGRLITGPGNLLPMQNGFFVAGDERANENIYLTAMHTLFMREHNYWADFFKAERPYLSGESVYKLARAVVGSEIQAITYNEFLPLLLGPNALAPYTGYKPLADAGIATEFATAAYRLGHSLLNGTLLRLEADGTSIPEGPIQLRDAFFNPAELVASGGITPLLRGAAAQTAQSLDVHIVDDVRNFLFGDPGQGGLDLASLNLQRGRDHGIGSYTQVRAALGLPAVTSFAAITSDPYVQSSLASVYGDVDEVDLWVGGLAEDQVAGSMVGPTFQAILVNQFTRSRNGDRFFYESYLPVNMRTTVRHTRLATVIRRNTEATILDLPQAVMQQIQPAASSSFGFESAAEWSVANGAISSNTDYQTDGNASLNVVGTGYVTVTNNAPFPASVLAGHETVKVDVFIPEQISSFYNAGSAQMTLNCTGAGINQAFLGHVELTYMPRGQFNTVSYLLPNSVKTQLAQHPAAGCNVTVALSLDGASAPYALDRLRAD